MNGGLDPNFYAGDRLLVLVAVLNGRFPKEPPYWDPHVIVATEDGWDDANGETWTAWSWDDVSWWMRLNRDFLPPITG